MTQLYNSFWRRNLLVCFIGSFSTVFAMTLMLPFLPLYVEELGVQGHAAIVQWSGVAFSATFITAGLIAPVWGKLGDKYGRKSMLVRASLGMAVTVSLMGMVTNIWQLVGLRLLVGLAGGYSSGATILIAVQAPRERVAWALGIVSCGVMAGNLIGPLAGGWLPDLFGIRNTFFCAGALIFLSFIMTLTLIREDTPKYINTTTKMQVNWSQLPARFVIVSMLCTGLLLMLANMSIEPIITVYVRTLVNDPAQITRVAGYVMAAAALGSIISASWLGKLADRIGHLRIITLALAIAGLLLIPQAFVTSGWQLIILRFLMGLALGGLLPCIAAVIRHHVPEGMIGSILGYSVAAQFAGQFIGPLIGGVIGGHIGMRAVFLATSVVLLLGAAWNFKLHRNSVIR
ncbi:TPA: MFS transporter [Proteus mirabilis]|uniref:MFS transporter n=1 Tax=Proteus mirabilis TaxID=584 RepID=UPI001583BB2A|nr:MFS transporter [Proteus mirabilis]EKT9734786.1 MFS transporter [Proteus mirabilis]EKW6744036.1 MFS transporter [Proteus mirabilis]MBG2925745.1 MFS transporter [Proteus mirabilis]MBI6371124.1 MFS transporter [Proteus mirabilis]MBI6498052.1 MFS transporter [Proteus mirabilis]